MACTVATVAQPVQPHAETLQVAHGRRVLLGAAQQANSSQSETLSGRSQCVQMVGMRTAEADQAGSLCRFGSGKMMRELEPLVARQFRINQIQTQHRQTHAAQPVESQLLQHHVGCERIRDNHQLPVRSRLSARWREQQLD